MDSNKRVCTRCVCDSTVPGIVFNEAGGCNYCEQYFKRSTQIFDPVQQEKDFTELVSRIKRSGKGKPYDCVFGVSGGIDSSYGLVKAVEAGLRPLAVHMDNGWNSELAQNNIANLVRTLGVDLYTHVIDWEEYRALMQAFFDAHVIDVELLYDNAMLAVNFEQAHKYGLRYILAGYNQATEGIPLPPGWTWNKFDRKNIVALAKKFGNVRLKTFPAVGAWEWAYYNYMRFIGFIPFLDYFPYDKYKATERLQNEFGYKPYPYKHYESIFTRFYQGYILPRKFNVDKRKIHLSNLVVSGQLSREKALSDLAHIPYPSEKELEEDKIYFLKKMNWTARQLDDYIAHPGIPHNAYPTEINRVKWVMDLRNKLPKSLSSRIVHLVKKYR
jgi:N-acetyl sugar amidotransferase